jgi:predicted nucleic acid-binding protein
MSYLIDTNVVIYYFNGLTADDDLHELLKKDFRISIITKIEFLGWREFGVNRLLTIPTTSADWASKHWA